jgi:hypothetical protein
VDFTQGVVVAALTNDPNDPRLTRGVDDEPTVQAEAYLVLSDEERAKGFVRSVRTSYIHDTCGTVTTMSKPLAETYARQPSFYGATWCVKCCKHCAVKEFRWIDGDGIETEDRVGS